MNKEKINTSLNQIEVPMEKLLAREKAAINHGKKKIAVKRTTKRSLLAACVLGLSLLGSGFVSTGMANALSNIPLIGTIYKDFRDIASEKLERDNIATIIDRQNSRDGITMTVKEAAYDGNRLMVSVMYTSEKDIPDLKDIGFGKILINGQPVDEVAGGQGGQDDLDENTMIEHHQLIFGNYDAYGDEIDVTVIQENMFGQDAKLEVTFPLQKAAGQTAEFSPKTTSKSNDGIYAITAEKVIFSPLATRIELAVDYPPEMNLNDTWPWFEYVVTDNTGEIYEGLKLQSGVERGKFGHHMILILPPMDTPPSSFNLKPRMTNKDGRLVYIEGLELVVPLK
ncbi:DUF4179 domain-containing protein [Solibacillus silvestris]|uniref:DUF4179 domain-containing protein n=1 Tax=Solibacillus silvestris TaxID=76853 RepID=UPI003F81AF3B